jgi:GTP-binding protein
VRGELAAYGNGLEDKPEIVALSKVDAVDAETLKQQMERLKRAIRSAGPVLAEGEKPRAPIKISAVAGEGVTDALRTVWKVVEGRRQDALKISPPPVWKP